MGPVSHFLFGALCGAAVACVALLFRRRWAAYAPPFILACGFFGYAWLHPAFRESGTAGFVLFLVVANVFVVAYAVFVTRYLWMLDTVRWEHGNWRGKRRRSKKRRSRERLDEE